MSYARYQVDIFDPFGGTALRAVPVVSCEYVLAERAVGEATIELPASVPYDRLKKDSLVLIWRAVGGGALQLEGQAIWLLRRRRRILDADGAQRTTIHAMHANHLLGRRIVAYAAGSAQCSKSGPADSVAAEIVDENLITPSDAGRTISLTSAPSPGAGPTVSLAFARRNVLAVLQDLCNASAQAGIYMGFEVRQATGTSLQFATYINQRGVDRRYGSLNYLPFGPVYGNVGAYELDEDWSEEETFIYSLGQGRGDDRAVATAQHALAETVSPYGRIEGTINAASEQRSSAQLTDEANQALYARRGRVRFRGEAQETARCIYGRDYGWGDLITVSVDGLFIPCRVDPVRIKFDRGGEVLQVQLQNDDVTVV